VDDRSSQSERLTNFVYNLYFYGLPMDSCFRRNDKEKNGNNKRKNIKTKTTGISCLKGCELYYPYFLLSFLLKDPLIYCPELLVIQAVQGNNLI